MSTEIRRKKPEKAAYYAVLNHFKVYPSNAVFVGHDKDEIEGAKAVGLHTVAYGYKKADFKARSFGQIVKYIHYLSKAE